MPRWLTGDPCGFPYDVGYSGLEGDGGVEEGGSTRSIGVSNFSTESLEEILAICEVRRLLGADFRS